MKKRNARNEPSARFKVNKKYIAPLVPCCKHRTNPVIPTMLFREAENM
jgi:hypothetical protein